MSVLFSRSCEYALQALVEMARHPEQKFWNVFKLAEQLNIPANFLAKIYQSLAKKGILISRKGAKGGFAFAEPPEQIAVLGVIETIDGLELVHECVMGLPQCGDDNPYPFHEDWKKIKEIIHTGLGKKSLANFAEQSGRINEQ